MTPFAPLIRLIRQKRNLRSKEAADLLGYEPSYLSALENGQKNPPQSEEFLTLLINRYQLDDEEIEKVRSALKRSKRSYLLPINATPDEYELFYLLDNRIGNLLPTEITLMRMILATNQSNTQY